MFRLLGFIIGSLTSIAIILLVTGVPTFQFEDPEIDQKRFDAAVEKLMARKIDSEQTESIGELTETVASNSTPDADIVAHQEDNGTPGAEHPAPAVAESSGPQGFEFVSNVAMPRIAPDTHWYSFWNPFRSQIAANGFVSQLEKVTGLDYRVVKTNSGVYEVAFAYVDDAERRQKLAQISAATGLDLPDS